MRYSEEYAKELLISWLNGNFAYVYDEIKRTRPKADAIALAVNITAHLAALEGEQAFSFRSFVQYVIQEALD